uniref:Complement component 1 Q subcomponent-binding protein, mitochondrial n=1 Tax=Panagrolaimus sp. ES5 TaxID=591445 RepID=A0AC34GRR0_9BILA
MFIKAVTKCVASRTIVRSICSLPKTSALISRSSLPLTLSRNFNTTKPSFSSVSTELASALDNEIDAEKRLESDNLGGSSSPSVPGFTVTANDAEVRLTKTYGSENILVVFNVNHSVDIDEDIESPDTAPVPVALPPFTIEITKGNERLCFQMLLTETDEPGQYDYRVEEFYIAPSATKENEDVEAYVYSSSGKYVDEGLHDLLFDRYLGERGFTPEFCQQLVNYATHYEHSCYVNLLQKIKNFVVKK